MENTEKKDPAIQPRDRQEDNPKGSVSENENQQYDQHLRKEDLPDSTNDSKGNTGSGQRQDSN